MGAIASFGTGPIAGPRHVRASQLRLEPRDSRPIGYRLRPSDRAAGSVTPSEAIGAGTNWRNDDGSGRNDDAGNNGRNDNAAVDHACAIGAAAPAGTASAS